MCNLKSWVEEKFYLLKISSLVWTLHQINSFTFIFPNIQTNKLGMVAFIHKRMLHGINN